MYSSFVQSPDREDNVRARKSSKGESRAPPVTSSEIAKDSQTPLRLTVLSTFCDANPLKELRRAKTSSDCCHHSPTYSYAVNRFFRRWERAAPLLSYL